MPKRSSQEKMDFYAAKIRKLQEKQQKAACKSQRRRVIIYSDSSDEESDNDIPRGESVAAVINEVRPEEPASTHVLEDLPMDLPPAEATMTSESSSLPPPTPNVALTEEAVPALDADFLSALGDTPDETPKYGENIHQDLAHRWLPILRRGLAKEPKDKLLKEYAVPDNCRLLRAPALNPEISAAITEATRNRDKKIETTHQQLGMGITAISRAMSLLFASDEKQSKVQSIKMLSDGCRILTDLHFLETQSRIKMITRGLDKAFLNIIQDVERDELLFGNKLSERIKASKTIEKQGLQIKKGVIATKAPTPSTSQTAARPRYQGNWTAPPRYQQPSNRGGRGGGQKNASTTHKAPSTATTTPAKSSTYAKQRAPPRQ